MIDVHADDYAISMNASEEMLGLCMAGLLDSMSVIPNMSCYEKAVQLYKENVAKFLHPVLLTVHLNFMEGYALSPKDGVSKLVDEDGLFNISWVKLFVCSYIPFLRGKIRCQLRTEICMQIDKVVQSGLQSDGIRLDTHEHTHLIPVVQDALYDVVKSGKYNISFIRNSSEHISAYLKHPDVLFSCRPVNFIKYMILNFYGGRLVRKFRKLNLAQGSLCGVLMSGRMDGRVAEIYEDLKTISDKKNERLELLFHPGKVLIDELNSEFNDSSANIFHLSPNRDVENAQVRALKHCNG